MNLPVIDDTLTITLASIVVHLDEFLHEDDDHARDIDEQTLATAIDDPEVKGFISEMPDALLPLKRDA